MILALHHMLLIALGVWIYRTYVGGVRHKALAFASALMLGIFVSIPITYFLAVLFQSLERGVHAYIVCVSIFMFCKRKDLWRNQREHSIGHIDWIFFAIFVFVSAYIMHKAFKVADDGVIHVARNAVFDMGHALSIIRSFSWGDNLPYQSPFVSGTAHLYHFMFYFWSAMYEYFGFPISFAVNFPSALGLVFLFLTTYIVGYSVFQSKATGILASVFLLFHGGFMFIDFFRQRGFSFSSLWRHDNYLFAGPFDGSLYSLFLTLNVFVNQRHLAFSLAIFFLLYISFVFQKHAYSKKFLAVYGLFLSLFMFWHILLAIGLFVSLCVYLGMKRKFREAFVLFVSTSFLGTIFLHQWIPYFLRGMFAILQSSSQATASHAISSVSLSAIPMFFFFNFGVSLLFFLFGVARSIRTCMRFLPVIALVFVFMLINVPFGIIDQKYLNVLQIIIALFSAYGVVSLFNRRIIISKIAIIILFPFLVLSGIIDFMVIKNDFLFPVSSTRNDGLVFLLREHTEKHATILGYEEIFDPITLSGRNNYYGFYKQPFIFFSEPDRYRRDKIDNVFSARDEETLRYAVADTGVDYILLPKNPKSDFPYTIIYDVFIETFPVKFEAFDHILLSVSKNL